MSQKFKAGPGRRDGLIASRIVFLCFVISVFWAASAALMAAEEQELPEEIYLQNNVYETDRKGPVWFSHSEHADGYVESCDGCHHEYRDGKNIWEEGQTVKKCVVCHDPSKSEGRVKRLNIAYHKNCKGCHRRLAEEEGSTEAPYKQCTDCHEKR
jgi:hypothetical protein